MLILARRAVQAQPEDPPPEVGEGIPFWGTPGDASNHTVPNYSTFLPESYSYPGDPLDVVVIDWRNSGNTAVGPQPGTPGTDGVWRVTQSDYSGISVGSTHNSLRAIADLMTADKAGTLVIPAGLYADRCVAKLTKHVIFRGAVDGNGKPDTWLAVNDDDFITVGATGSKTELETTSEGAIFDVRNMILGPFQAAIDANGGDTGSYRFGRGVHHVANFRGQIFLRNCKLTRVKGDGIACPETNYTTKSLTGHVWCYDCELVLCAGGGLVHNVYVHSLASFGFVRSASHSSLALHALKIDSSRCFILNCFLQDHMEVGLEYEAADRVLNVTQTVDLYVHNTLFAWHASNNGKFAIEFVSRNDQWGGMCIKRPPVMLGMHDNTNQPFWLPTWIETGTQQSEHSVGRVSQSGLASGTSTLTFEKVGGELDKFVDRDLSAAGTWDIQIRFSDDTIQTTTGVISAHAPGSITFNISPDTLDRSAVFRDRAKFKPQAAAWDRPLVDERMYNRQHADYYWGTILDVNGDLDMAEHAKFPVHVFDNCLFVLLENPSFTDICFVNTYTEMFRRHWRTTLEGVSTLVGPINNPAGATGGWPNDAEAGAWTGEIEGAALSWEIMGVTPSVIDFVWHYPNIFRNIGFHDDDATIGLSHHTQTASSSGETEDIYTGSAPVQKLIGTTGGVSDIAAGNQSPFTGRVKTKLASGASAAATTVSVISAAGMSIGDRIQIFCDSDLTEIYGDKLFSTVIADIDGTTITLTDGLIHAADSGDFVSVFPNSTAVPVWWPEALDAYNAAFGAE
jgi:hypothetical protein